MSQDLVQYIILNYESLRDWAKGAIAAQTCHASVAAIIQFKNTPDVQLYTSADNLPHMRKVILQADHKQFGELEATLSRENVDFVSWEELPEHIKTCIALRPYRKNHVIALLNHLKLYK